MFSRISSMLVLAAVLPSCATPVAGKRDATSASYPVMGTAEDFAVLGGSTVTNTGPSVVTGNLGLSPGTAITGFPPGNVIGETHAADAEALQAQTDTTIAYDDLAAQPCDVTYSVPTDIGGSTLVPGVYCFASSAQVTGVLTLDAEGNPDSVWVFKMGSTLTTATRASVQLINGAQECNVFWQVGSSATLGTGTSFIGNILALTSITLNTEAGLFGRALARNGAVTLDSNVISVSVCSDDPAAPTPTVGKVFTPQTVAPGEISTLTITLGNAGSTDAVLTVPLTDSFPEGMTVAGVARSTCGGSLTAILGSSSVTLTGASIPADGSCTVTVAVTADLEGEYCNKIPVGTLQTSNGANHLRGHAELFVE